MPVQPWSLAMPLPPTPPLLLPLAPAVPRWRRRLRQFVPSLVVCAGVLLSACAAALQPPPLPATGAAAGWPPVWSGGPIEDPQQRDADAGPPAFSPPSAAHCRRAPGAREVAGGGRQGGAWARPPVEERSEREVDVARRAGAAGATAPPPAGAPSRDAATAMAKSAKSAMSAMSAGVPLGYLRDAPPALPAPPAQPAPTRSRPANEVVTAGVVDDNADFGEYLAYRQRKAGLPVRERDVSERYLLEVTDAQNRPLHDAEVAVQRAGTAEPVMWARTDTAGRVWLHPKAFLNAGDAGERSLAVTVRKGGAQARGVLLRGQPQALQLRLGVNPAAARPRLDLVFMVDATGSMGDEIAKLKTSMQAMAQQIAQLPGQPEVCFGLVAYRDRGDAYITRTHDFTDRLDAFQQVLGDVHAAGGGDTPEALNEALHEVVHGLSWRADAARMVVLVADAPPHLDYGGPQYDRDMQAALAKGIKLFAVGASGLDPVGEYIFRQMAQYTAGRFVFLTYRRATDPGSGPGAQTVHDVKQYSVQTLDALVLRLVGEEMARLKRS